MDEIIIPVCTKCYAKQIKIIKHSFEKCSCGGKIKTKKYVEVEQ